MYVCMYLVSYLGIGIRLTSPLLPEDWPFQPNSYYEISVVPLKKNDFQSMSLIDYHLNLELQSWMIGQKLIQTFSLWMVASPDGVMWIQKKHMLPRCDSKRNVIVNMIVFGANSVRYLHYAVVSTSAQGMDIVVVDFVRWWWELSYFLHATVFPKIVLLYFLKSWTPMLVFHIAKVCSNWCYWSTIHMADVHTNPICPIHGPIYDAL